MTEYSFERDEVSIHESLKGYFGDDSFSAFQLAGDASARRYFRIVKEQRSFVLMVWEPFEDNDDYPFLSVLNHFQKLGIGVPQVYFKAPENGLVLLEDLGDLTLERKFWENHNQELVLPYYEKSLAELSKIHFETNDGTNSTALRTSFDIEKFLWEMNYAKKHLLQDFCKLSFSAEEEKVLEDSFTSICKSLDDEPKVVCHRDFHSRNIMIQNGETKIIDFQDARLGPVQYDLVSILKDSYVDLDQKIHNQLLDRYFQQNDLSGRGYNKDLFYELYEVQSIQRCFKACGSFASFFNTRNDKRYLGYISKTLRRVRKSAEHFSQYSDFVGLLQDKGLFDRNFEVE